MINVEQIRAYFRDTIIASGIFTPDAIDWENYVRPTDLPYPNLWMRENYLPIDEGYSDSVNGDQIQGIFQYSINALVGTFDVDVTGAGVALGNLFPTTTIIKTADYRISIDATKRSFQGVLVNGSKWYTVVIDVEFKAYE